MHFKLAEKNFFRKVGELFYTFVTVPDELENYNELIEKMAKGKIMAKSIFGIFLHTELQLINTKTVIKNKLKDLLGQLKN